MKKLSAHEIIYCKYPNCTPKNFSFDECIYFMEKFATQYKGGPNKDNRDFASKIMNALLDKKQVESFNGTITDVLDVIEYEINQRTSESEKTMCGDIKSSEYPEKPFYKSDEMDY